MIATVICKFANEFFSSSSSSRLSSILTMRKNGTISSPKLDPTDENAIGLFAFVAANDRKNCSTRQVFLRICLVSQKPGDFMDVGC